MLFFIVPDEIQSMNFSSVTATSGLIFWSPPLDFNGIPLGYQIELTNTLLNTSISRSLGVNTTTYSSTLLDEFVTYQFTAAAYTAAGRGPSRSVTFQTCQSGMCFEVLFDVHLFLHSICIAFCPLLPIHPMGTSAYCQNMRRGTGPSVFVKANTVDFWGHCSSSMSSPAFQSLEGKGLFVCLLSCSCGV